MLTHLYADAVNINDNPVASEKKEFVEKEDKSEKKVSARPKKGSKKVDHLFWPHSLVYHFSFGEKLPNMLKDFCSMQDINVVLSQTLLSSDKTVHRSFKDLYPVELWSQLTKSYGLLWFYDGNVLYVYDSTECETKTLQVHPDQVDALVSIINQLGFYSSRIGLTTFKEGGIIIASGTPKFIQILEEITKNMRFYKQNMSDDVDVRVFLLKHAWALDRTIGSVQVPGVATLLNDILGNAKKQGEEANKSVIDTKIAHKVQAIGGLANETKDLKSNADVSNKEQKKGIDDKKEPALPQGGGITTDGRQNALIIKDVRKNFPLYEKLIAKLDVPLELIEIQAAIVNVDRNMGLGIGTNFIKAGDGTKHIITIQPLKTDGEGLDFSGKLSGIVNGKEFLTTIQCLENSSLSKVLARPSVVTMDNITAVMDRSETIYLPITSQKSSDMYSVTGSTKLSVTPHIICDENGRRQIQLLLDIKDESVMPSTKEKDKYSVSSSSILTQAVVYENQSVLVGGYFNESFNKNEQGIPFLKDIPILGYAFKNKLKNKQVCERLFLITPTIIHLSASQADHYSQFFETPSPMFKASESFVPQKAQEASDQEGDEDSDEDGDEDEDDEEEYDDE